MDFLARREHSYRELLRKMQLKFAEVNPELISEVLTQLAEEGLQSDDRFTESWVRYRQSRGFGYLHILSDLKERGVAAATVDRYLFSDDAHWQETANDLLQRRLTSEQKIEFGSKYHRKLMRYLESRGFGSSEVRRALQPYLD